MADPHYADGRAARRQNRPITDCPAASGHRLSSWRRGWQDQDFEEKQRPGDDDR